VGLLDGGGIACNRGLPAGRAGHDDAKSLEDSAPAAGNCGRHIGGGVRLDARAATGAGLLKGETIGVEAASGGLLGKCSRLSWLMLGADVLRNQVFAADVLRSPTTLFAIIPPMGMADVAAGDGALQT
jgi:hypothetical protein